jgi:hypothetical protein
MTSRHQLFGFTEEVIFLNEQMFRARRAWALRERELEARRDELMESDISRIEADAQRIMDIQSGKVMPPPVGELMAELDDIAARNQEALLRLEWASVGLEVYRYTVDVPEGVVPDSIRIGLGRWIVGHGDGSQVCEEFLFDLDSPPGKLRMWGIETTDFGVHVGQRADYIGSLFWVDNSVLLVSPRLTPFVRFLEVPMIRLGEAPVGWEVTEVQFEETIS